jgi:short-subunit dehydrogenase
VPNTLIITGASAGIGKALAWEFARRNCRLGLTGRRLEALEQLQSELQAQTGVEVHIARIDVDETDSVEQNLLALCTKLGDVDSIVINAGINNFTRVGSGQLADETAIIHTNLIGAMATANAAVSYFLEKGRGQIVGISSLASLQPIPSQAAYCASKAGISMYLDALRIEHKDNNIDVTQIRPGFIKTEIMENIDRYPFAISAEQAAKEMAKAILARRKDVFVPRLPWSLFRPALGHLPDKIWKRFK